MGDFIQQIQAMLVTFDNYSQAFWFALRNPWLRLALVPLLAFYFWWTLYRLWFRWLRRRHRWFRSSKRRKIHHWRRIAMVRRLEWRLWRRLRRRPRAIRNSVLFGCFLLYCGWLLTLLLFGIWAVTGPRQPYTLGLLCFLRYLLRRR